MAVMDEFKEERARMKDAPFKEKWKYFWDYHKFHVLAGVIGLIFVTVFIHDMVTRKDIVFDVALVNHYAGTAKSDALKEEFLPLLDINTKKQDIYFDSSFQIDYAEYSQETIASSEKLMAQAAAHSLHIIISNESLFESYAANEFFLDLTEILDEGQLEKYRPYFYYLSTESGDIPVGIYLEECARFTDVYTPLTEERSVLGVMGNLEEYDTCIQFVEFLFSEPAL